MADRNLRSVETVREEEVKFCETGSFYAGSEREGVMDVQSGESVEEEVTGTEMKELVPE